MAPVIARRRGIGWSLPATSIVLVALLVTVSIPSSGTSLGSNGPFERSYSGAPAVGPSEIHPDGGPTTPAGCSSPSAFIGVNIWNNRTVTLPGYDQFVRWNAYQTASAFASNLSNLAVAYFNGTLIPTWIQANDSKTSSSVELWLRLYSLAGNTHILVYFYSCSGLMMSQNGPTGEAPQLTTHYAAFDNGRLVFPFYDNFSGTSLKSQWSAGSFINPMDFTINNGFHLVNTVGSGAQIKASSFTTTAGFVDFYANASVTAAIQIVLGGLGGDLYTGGGSAAGNSIFAQYTSPNTQWGYEDATSSADNLNDVNAGMVGNLTYTVAVNSGHYSYACVQGSCPSNFNYTTDIPASPYPVSLVGSYHTATACSAPTCFGNVYWIRERAYLPVMPAEIVNGTLAPPAPPTKIYIPRATGSTLTINWTKSVTASVTSYNVSLFPSTQLCQGSPTTVSVNNVVPLTTKFTGLSANTRYSVTVTSESPGGPSAASSCVTASNGVVATTAYVAGWTTLYRNFQWRNVTLTNTATTRFFFSATNGFNSPVIAMSNPSGDPQAYYLAQNGSILHLDLKTGSSGVQLLSGWDVHEQVPNAEPNLLMPVVNDSDGVIGLFECQVTSTATTTSVETHLYSLLNHTLSNVTTNNFYYGNFNTACGTMEDAGWGWFYWEDQHADNLTAWNVYSHQRVVSAQTGIVSSWNSATYIPVANQVLMDYNNYTSHTVSVRIWQLNSGDTAIAYREIASPSDASVVSTDINNEPYYYWPDGSGGAWVWGIGADETGDTGGHVLNLTLAASIGSDTFTSIASWTGILASDMTIIAEPSPEFFSLDGGHGATPGTAPFMNEPGNISIFDNGSTGASVWFNQQFTDNACIDFCVSSAWANSWTYIPVPETKGNITGVIEAPEGTSSVGGMLFIYNVSAAPIGAGSNGTSGGGGGSGGTTSSCTGGIIGGQAACFFVSAAIVLFSTFTLALFFVTMVRRRSDKAS